MEVFKINELGITTPFDLDAYTEEIRSQTYRKTREEQRQKAHDKKTKKKMMFLRKLFGVFLLAISFCICKLMLTMGEHDITYIIFLLPLAIIMIFGKE